MARRGQLVAAGLERTSTIVVLGGGVVGDLASFVAATPIAAVDVIHLPPTLVAMTDTAIGGKTAVDLPAGKSLRRCLLAAAVPGARPRPLPPRATPRRRVGHSSFFGSAEGRRGSMDSLG